MGVKRSYYGWAIVWASTVSAFGMAPMFGPVLGVFFSSIESELGWNRATIALAFTIGSATGSVFQMLTGRLLDRYGARMVVVAAGVIIALAMVGLSWMQEPWQFWLAFGAGRGSALAGISRLARAWRSPTGSSADGDGSSRSAAWASARGSR